MQQQTLTLLPACLLTQLLVCLPAYVAAAPLTNLASEHPRIFINQERLPILARYAQGGLAEEYALIKREADRAVEQGVQQPRSRFHRPLDQICLGIAYLIERQLGHEAAPYAQAIKDYWGDGQVLSLDGSGHFGYHAMVYDWIYDALTPTERVRFGDALGEWLRWYTDVPEITLKHGHWWYNQTWGPAHLNTPNTRDGITPKLMVALALAGAETARESDAWRFLDSWATRVPAECIPAFDEMGGVWSESMGHGNYGPIAVIPWAFEAWYTATGEDLFQQGTPDTFLRGMTRWALHLTVPFSGQTAWIDDNRAANLAGFARVAPILGAHYQDPLANGISDESWRKRWHQAPWNRFLSYDPTVPASTPAAQNEPLAIWFKGAGHVYMRSEWGNPNATWAFFGAGPKFAGHSRDDEGHFLIARKGYLVMRAGGDGHNDSDYYVGGSLAFNIVTIYDPDERFRRTSPGPQRLAQGGTKNENDGGLIRHVYSSHTRTERGKIVAYAHDDRLTYVAADLTEGYRARKVREVTRQFLYLRGEREFFVIFDRVEATEPRFPKTWFLHIPSEPAVEGEAEIQVPGHVVTYRGNRATWLSSHVGERPVQSTGRSRAFLKTLLPEQATIVKRGGKGHELWGHPHEPSAQYNHVGRRSLGPPIVPWRLEVESPGGENREYFLHVLEVGDEADRTMSPCELVRTPGRAGVRLERPDGPVQIFFGLEDTPTVTVIWSDGTEQFQTSGSAAIERTERHHE